MEQQHQLHYAAPESRSNLPSVVHDKFSPPKLPSRQASIGRGSRLRPKSSKALSSASSSTKIAASSTDKHDGFRQLTAAFYPSTLLLPPPPLLVSSPPDDSSATTETADDTSTPSTSSRGGMMDSPQMPLRRQSNHDASSLFDDNNLTTLIERPSVFVPGTSPNRDCAPILPISRHSIETISSHEEEFGGDDDVEHTAAS